MNQIPESAKVAISSFFLIAGYFICYFLGKWIDWGSFSFAEGIIWYPIVGGIALVAAGIGLFFIFLVFVIIHCLIWKDTF